LELVPHLEPGAIVTDLAPVRRIVQESVHELGLSDRHAGSCPVVAAHGTGFHGAAPALFRGVMVYICPSSPDDSAARGVARFWSDVLEAQPVTVSAGTIDERTAWRVQLPALVAAAIAGAQVGHGSVAPGGATGGRGDESTLRAELLLANRDEVLRALNGVGEHLASLQALIAGGDRAGLQALLDANAGAPGHGAR
jgi:prephenate dehydrogenase